jgi:hypothetical protein
VRLLALHAAGRLRGLGDHHLAEALEHPEPAVRSAGLHAAARMGLPSVAWRSRAAATRGTDPDAEALAFLGVLGEAQDVTVLQSAVSRPDLAEAAIAGLGAMGRVEAIPFLLELMSDETHGVAATAAYRRITGATGIEGQRPFPPPPVAEGEDEEEALPPDPAKAKADWKRRESTMTADRAWQSGMAIGEGSLPADFDHLPLESRRDVFLRLCARNGGRGPDLEIEALARRQRRG